MIREERNRADEGTIPCDAARRFVANRVECGGSAFAQGGGQYVLSYHGTDSYIQGSGGQRLFQPGGQNASCRVFGDITFTWDPGPNNAPVPGSAFIVEQCSAGGGGYGYPAPPSASASDDLGDAQTSSQQGNQLQVMSTGFRYSVQSGPVLTTYCSPSASASVAMGSVSVSASYSAAVTPVTVAVVGTTPVSVGGVSMPGVIIGQGLTVSLMTIPNTTFSTFSWNITGDPFEGFQTTATTGGALELTDDIRRTAAFTYFYRSIQGGSPEEIDYFVHGNCHRPKEGGFAYGDRD